MMALDLFFGNQTRTIIFFGMYTFLGGVLLVESSSPSQSSAQYKQFLNSNKKKLASKPKSHVMEKFLLANMWLIYIVFIIFFCVYKVWQLQGRSRDQKGSTHKTGMQVAKDQAEMEEYEENLKQQLAAMEKQLLTITSKLNDTVEGLNNVGNEPRSISEKLDELKGKISQSQNDRESFRQTDLRRRRNRLNADIGMDASDDDIDYN
eukprot:m.28024 g.28024  ORF g.28024 m.28024 type:complete len:206 (+) comp15847_c0_seq1:74-691(+)